MLLKLPGDPILLYTLQMFLTLTLVRSELDQDIHRFGSGIKFSFLQSFSPISTYWDHSFIVNVPLHLLMNSHRELSISNATATWMDWIDKCLIDQDILAHGPQHAHEIKHDNETEDKEFGIDYSYCNLFGFYFKQLAVIA